MLVRAATYVRQNNSTWAVRATWAMVLRYLRRSTCTAYRYRVELASTSMVDLFFFFIRNNTVAQRPRSYREVPSEV